MPETLPTAKRLATAGVLFGLLSGCAQINDWLRFDRGAPVDDGVSLGAPGADDYLQDMYQLAAGDPATQAEIFADSEAAATLTPGPSTRLRLALVLATPGHAHADAERAQDLLRDLLSQTELLAPGEISLATIHLREVEQRIMLAGETERLRAESSRNASSEQAAVEQRIARIELENQRLRRSLAEAEQKLEAITSIERSIRDQSSNGNQQ